MSKSDIVERLRSGAAHQTLVTTGLVNQAADEITRLHAEVERLRVENIQMQAALGYGILAEDERLILPSNPFKCGTCDASKHLRAENEKLMAALREWENAVYIGATAEGPIYIGVSSTLGQKAWKLTRAALGDTHD